MSSRSAVLAFTLSILLPLSALSQDPGQVLPRKSVVTSDGAIALLPQEKGTPPPDIVQVDREPVVKKKAEPRYPEVAKKAGIEGKVWVKLWVDTEGKVRDAQVLKSDHPTLVEASLDAARKWEFEPAILKGKPVAVWVSIPFAFKLADKMIQQGPGHLLTETVTKILQGTQLDSCKQAVDPSAYLVNGSEYVPLLTALDTWGEKGGFPGGQGRSVSFLHGRGSASSDVFTLVLKTEGKKGAAARFHTVVWSKSAGGDWKITQWHTSE